MRLFGSIALLHALPPLPTLAGRSISALGTVGDLSPAILLPPDFFAVTGAVTGTSVTTITGNVPTRHTGDLLIAHCQIIGSGKTFSVSSGWTLGDTSADGAACWAWRYVDGTETSPAFSWSGAVNCSVQVSDWTGVKSSGAIGTIGKASGSGTTISQTGIVTTADLSRVVSIACAQSNQTVPVASGYTSHSFNASANGSFRLQSEGVPVVASSGSISTTISSAAWESFLIEIKRA